MHLCKLVRLLLLSLMIAASVSLANTEPKNITQKPVFNEDWSRCKKDKDCMITEGPCGEPKAINGAYSTPHREYLVKVQQMLLCQALVQHASHEALRVKCVKGKCDLVPFR